MTATDRAGAVYPDQKIAELVEKVSRLTADRDTAYAAIRAIYDPLVTLNTSAPHIQAIERAFAAGEAHVDG